MDNELTQVFAGLWSKACQDKLERPSCKIEDGQFVMTISGNQERWEEMLKVAGVPSNAEQMIDGDKLICRWHSYADEIFGPSGLIAQKLPNYEMREPQLHMARMVQRAIEMKAPATIEAGTGVGKSFAYAAICMAMGKRVAISTSNKALQMQLYRKDIPFLQTLFPGKKIALVQGKQNYACRYRIEDVGSGTYSIGGQLLDWYLDTESGNVEEIPFAVEYAELKNATPDHYCDGKECSRYHDCFYYIAKAKRQDADVLILNHMLLAMHGLYPGAGILPPVDVIVVDEAHQYAGYMQNAVGIDLPTTSITSSTKKHIESTHCTPFFNALNGFVGMKAEREIAIERTTRIEDGVALARKLSATAESIWPEEDKPESKEERRRQKDANRLRNTAGLIRNFSEPTPDGFVRWIEKDRDGILSCRVVPVSVAEHIARLVGFHTQGAITAVDFTHCAKCGRKLTAATVNVLEGLPYGPDCIRHVDPMGDAEQVTLSEWLNQDLPEPRTIHSTPTPVVFCSATLAAPDMKAFLRDTGLPYALQMVATSPFDYVNNALLYVPSAADAPAPNQGDTYRDWMVEEMAQLVRAAQGGAFLLFTSYANMKYVSERLRYEFEQASYPVFVQGQLPKLEIVKQFTAAGNGVLFATKSFWEGVSIDGNDLRLVVIDKMPFEAPGPLNQAQEAALTQWARSQGMSEKQASWYPFEALRVPRMIIDLKQGAGRLIRTQTDRGVMAILDARLRSAQYARRLVLPSLPPAKLTANLYEVDMFYREGRKAEEQKALLAELPPVELGKELAGVDELWL